MAYTVYDFSESLNRLSNEVHGITKDDVAECLSAWGYTGDYAEWTGGFWMRLKDDRRVYLSGWCDTTGWGCQDGIEVYIFDALADRNVETTKHLESWQTKPHDWDDSPADLNRFLHALN